MEPITISLSIPLVKTIVILIWVSFLLKGIEIILFFYVKRLNKTIALLKEENLKNAIDYLKSKDTKNEKF